MLDFAPITQVHNNTDPFFSRLRGTPLDIHRITVSHDGYKPVYAEKVVRVIQRGRWAEPAQRVHKEGFYRQCMCCRKFAFVDRGRETWRSAPVENPGNRYLTTHTFCRDCLAKAEKACKKKN